jgi:hypothetical protein
MERITPSIRLRVSGKWMFTQQVAKILQNYCDLATLEPAEHLNSKVAAG